MSIVPSLIEHCSPTLAGLKAGSLFSIVSRDWETLAAEADALREQFAPKGLVLRFIRVSPSRVLCYLYRPAQLETLLARPDSANFLRSLGYEDVSASGALDELCARMARSDPFPHEVGLFLGYPLADVIAFIQNKGKNCLCCGCYKAYTDECAAQKLFAKFDKCTRVYRRLFTLGHSLHQLTVAA